MAGEVTEEVFCQKASSVAQTFIAPMVLDASELTLIDTRSTCQGLELDPLSSRPGPAAEYLGLLGKFFCLPN